MNKTNIFRVGDRVICTKEIIMSDFKIEVGEVCKVKDVLFNIECVPFFILIQPEREGVIENMEVWGLVDNLKKIERNKDHE